MSEQPPPTKNNNPAVWDAVIADMQTRDKIGEKRYGTRLQPHNGRNSLQDAYEEALDQVVYLKQRIMEDEWQPIETAPKDGTHVLCFVPDDDWGQPIRVLKYVLNWSMPGISGLKPTHWKPIPAPPK